MVEIFANANADEIDLDRIVDGATGFMYIGKARKTFGGRWLCLAQVGRALCRVELRVSPTVHVDGDAGDEDDQFRRRLQLEADLGRELPL